MSDALQHASRALASAEFELGKAEAALTEVGLQRGAIEERIAAKGASIADARRTRVERALTEQQAAQFNLDLMDLEDLQDLLPAANGTVLAAAAKVKAAQTTVANQRAYVDHVTNENRLRRLVACAMELEQQLCATLQEAFDVARDMGQRKSMRELWTPSQALENTVRQNRAPNGAL